MRTLGMFVDGGSTSGSFLLWMHAGDAGAEVALPDRTWGSSYDVLLDTTLERPRPGRLGLRPGDVLSLTARSAALLRCNHHYSARRAGEAT